MVSCSILLKIMTIYVIGDSNLTVKKAFDSERLEICSSCEIIISDYDRDTGKFV